MANELNFESLLSQLEQNSRSIEKGKYKFTELTMNDQRKILNIGFNPIEIPVRISNIFNEFIRTSVEDVNDITDVMHNITIDVKPFLIVQLRNLTLGDKYVDSNSNTTYTLYDVKEEDLESSIEPAVIQFNNFILRLAVPSLAKDQNINGQLLLELGNFKKKLSDEDYGKVADLYQIYELMKFITEIELDGNVFDFEKSPVNKKMKIINSLPQRVISEITDYVESVKALEQKALTAVDELTNETIEVEMSTLFFAKNAREKK